MGGGQAGALVLFRGVECGGGDRFICDALADGGESEDLDGGARLRMARTLMTRFKGDGQLAPAGEQGPKRRPRQTGRLRNGAGHPDGLAGCGV